MIETVYTVWVSFSQHYKCANKASWLVSFGDVFAIWGVFLIV